MSRPQCPRCERQMRPREGGTGVFYACSRWPTCRGMLPPDDRLRARCESLGLSAASKKGMDREESGAPIAAPIAPIAETPGKQGTPIAAPIAPIAETPGKQGTPIAAPIEPIKRRRFDWWQAWLFTCKYVLAPLVVAVVSGLILARLGVGEAGKTREEKKAPPPVRD